MHRERRPSKGLSIPPLPADARRAHSGITPLGTTSRAGAEEKAGCTRIARPPSAPLLTPMLPRPLLTSASPVDHSAGLDWDDEDLSTRLFDRPPELAQVSNSKVSNDDDVEVEMTPRISRREFEQLHVRLQQDVSPGGARTLLQAASLRKAGRLTKLLLATLVCAACTLLWVSPERDVSELAQLGQRVMHEFQAAYAAIVSSVWKP